MEAALIKNVRISAKRLQADLEVLADRKEPLSDDLFEILMNVQQDIEKLELVRSENDQRWFEFRELPHARKPKRQRGRKREIIVYALETIEWPASPAFISRVAGLFFNVDLDPSQFSAMRKGDERSWKTGRGRNRTIIVPTLNAEDLTARARTYSLSSWPLDRRIMGSLSERANALRIILSFIEKFNEESDERWKELSLFLAADFTSISNDHDTLCDLKQFAGTELEKIDEPDREERQEAAYRRQSLNLDWQLFGRLVALDTEELRWTKK